MSIGESPVFMLVLSFVQLIIPDELTNGLESKRLNLESSASFNSYVFFVCVCFLHMFIVA